MAVSRPLSITTASRRAKLLLLASLVAALVCSLPQLWVFDLLQSSFFKKHNLACISILSAGDDSHDDGDGSSYRGRAYNLFAFAMMYGVPLISIAWCYCRILCVLTTKTREHRRNCMWQHNSGSLTDSGDCSRQQQRSSPMASASAKVSLRRSDARNIERARLCTLKLTVFIVLGFLLCWAPHWIITLHYTFAASQSRTDDGTLDLVHVGLSCAFFNSCINPVIYGMFSKHFSNCMKKHCPCLEKRLFGTKNHRDDNINGNCNRNNNRKTRQGGQYQMVPLRCLGNQARSQGLQQQQQQQHKLQLHRAYNPRYLDDGRVLSPARRELLGAAAAGTDEEAAAGPLLSQHHHHQQQQQQPEPVPCGSSGGSGTRVVDDLLRGSGSSGSSSGQQQQQKKSAAGGGGGGSTHRLERNAFDKIYTPLYGIN